MQRQAESHRPDTAIFDLAADVLAGDVAVTAEAAARARGFLNLLGYAAPAGAADRSDDTVGNRIALLRAAARLGGIFRLHSRNAPGLTFFGATAAPPVRISQDVGGLAASLNGAGETAGEAFEACIGEGVEYLSQFRQAGDVFRTATPAPPPWNDSFLIKWLREWIGEEPSGAPGGWMEATRLFDGQRGCLPAALVLREPRTLAGLQRRLALSSGCAAGPSWAEAVTSALFEVVERDAVAMWWRGGRAGRTIALETLARAGIGELIGRIRQNTNGRVTSLVDISSDCGIPCVAALSFDRKGKGFAGGYACRSSVERACRAAVIEMCQMELGQDIVAQKRSRLGADALNEADRQLEMRSAAVDPHRRGLIQGLAGTASLPTHFAGDAEQLAEAAARLASKGFHAYAVDLTRPEFAIPVARVIVPGLQPYPSTFVSPRLAVLMEAISSDPGCSSASSIDLF